MTAEDKSTSIIFDLPCVEGLNESERLLTKLCKRSFLSLWSYTNLFTDEDMRGGKGSGKELCDVLAVFGDDIVIFSDKHVGFNTDKPLDVAWKRWCKRAILESASQLYGAVHWIKRFPDRVFQDARCTRPLPIKLPPVERARFHLVAVTRGSYDACACHFEGSSGTLMINTDIKGRAHLDVPFTAGIVDDKKEFIHVLDEFSLEVVLGELDTVDDLVTYFAKREEFLSNPDRSVIATGEEQLLAAYLRNMSEDEHSFLPPAANDNGADLIFFDESHFGGLKKNPGYRRKKEADKPSYVWDKLIERFIQIGDPSLVHPEYVQRNEETEKALRQLAAESRFRRRQLATAMLGVLRDAEPGRRRARMLLSQRNSDLAYVFLVMPKQADESLDMYRQHRIAFLHAYCRCAQLRFPDVRTFIGIALDHPKRDYKMSSEDLLMYSTSELTEDAREEAEQFREELGILGEDVQFYQVHDDEFPQGLPDDERQLKNRGREKKKAEKRKAKAARASKRRNRR